MSLNLMNVKKLTPPAALFANLDLTRIIKNNVCSNLFDTDSYKTSHWLMLPPNTTRAFSYIESRGGKYDKIVFFGLQYYIKKYLKLRITKKDVDQAYIFYTLHGVPFNYDGWMRIVKKHGGRLPIRVRALKEGTVVATQRVLVTIESTDDELAWLTTWVETNLLRVWYPITVATLSYHIKQDIKTALEETSDDPEVWLPTRLHGFGSRGVSSQESAGIGDMAHLATGFTGTDTTIALIYTMAFYNAKRMPGFSIPASEHFVITAWGREGEADAYANILEKFGMPNAVFACVSDTYDLLNAVSNIWGGTLRQKVIDSGAVVVIRPDSGDPVKMVCDTLVALDEKFGSVLNKKKFKVLNHVRVIQGDGINHEMIKKIIAAVIALGFSLENVAFGMGGALLQSVNRDTQNFAMKGSWFMIDGKGRAVRKDPITDPGKRSKMGRLDTVFYEGRHAEAHLNYESVNIPDGMQDHPDSDMHVVFEDGEEYNETTFDEVRHLLAA